MTDSDATDHADEKSTNVDGEEEEDPGWPWSFLLLVFAGALYLIFRFYEMAKELFS